MKDARGHGSNTRGSSARVDLMRNRVALAPSARFSGRTIGPPTTDTQRHLADLRDRLRNSQGPGHAHAIVQGIKNIFGRT